MVIRLFVVCIGASIHIAVQNVFVDNGASVASRKNQPSVGTEAKCSNRIAVGTHHKTGTEFAGGLKRCLKRSDCAFCDTEHDAFGGPRQKSWPGVVDDQCDRLLHMVRDPLDLVRSAYLFHKQVPAVEPWLKGAASGVHWAHTVDEATCHLPRLQKSLLQEQPTDQESYFEYLHRVSEGDGILFEMMKRSCDAVTEMTEAFKQTVDDERVLSVCLDELFYDFDGTVSKIVTHFGVKPMQNGVWQCLQTIDPARMKTKTNKKGDTHFTHYAEDEAKLAELANKIRILDDKHFGGMYTMGPISEFCQQQNSSRLFSHLVEGNMRLADYLEALE